MLTDWSGPVSGECWIASTLVEGDQAIAVDV
jgi:hypothetical protein